MIFAVKCDQPSFKNVYFERGLNVVLAERTKDSTRKDTRNGLGKSTLIEIIHFCFGSTLSGTLKDEHLLNWTFTLDFELSGKVTTVSRNTESSNRLVVEGDFAEWPLKPKRNPKTGDFEFSVTQWRCLLGALMFGLPVDEEANGNKPTFRGLISYFIRSGPEAYGTPFEQHRKQREAEIQVFNAYLLNLDWNYANEWQHLKEKEKLLADIKKASKTGMMKDVFGGSLGDLEAKRVQLELAVQKRKECLDSFRVHPQYEEIEKRADEITQIVHELENQNVADSQLLTSYKRSVADEKPPTTDDLLRIYEEAKIVIPETVKLRFEDVREFHEKLVQNRRSFLEAEIEQLTKTIESRRVDAMRIGEEKVSLMQILKTHGALEEYTRLQQLHLETVSQLREIEQRIQNLKKFEEGKSEVSIEKQLLQRRARTDLEERHSLIRQAIALFNENSQTLYQSPGTLAIDVTQTGFKFHIEIERSKSEGIGNMKVFCYDLMLAQLWSERPQNPGLLIHDSTIFDGVDERQRALAIELVKRESEARGFQYICMLNSDMLPTRDFSDSFNLNDFVRLRLTDATDDGGLLGIRF